MDNQELTSFSIMQELNRAEIHRQNPQKYRAALVAGLRLHAVDAARLNNHNNEVHVGGEWYVVRNRTGEWEQQRRRT